MTTKTTKGADEAAPAAVDPFTVEMQRLLADVSTNTARVGFPLDRWGMTTALRKAGLQAASSIRGNAEKHRVFLGTLAILGAHAKARLEADAAAVQARVQDEVARDRNDRVFGRPVPAPESEAAVPVAL